MDRHNDKDTQTELNIPIVHLHKNKTHIPSSPQLYSDNDEQNEQDTSLISVADEKKRMAQILGHIHQSI